MTGSLVALLVLLVLPSLRTHHFACSYKPIEAQSAARHWTLDLNDDRTARSIDQAAHVRFLTTSTPVVPRISAVRRPVPVSPLIGIARLRVRLRLGPTRASDPPLFR